MDQAFFLYSSWNKWLLIMCKNLPHYWSHKKSACYRFKPCCSVQLLLHLHLHSVCWKGLHVETCWNIKMILKKNLLCKNANAVSSKIRNQPMKTMKNVVTLCSQSKNLTHTHHYPPSTSSYWAPMDCFQRCCYFCSVQILSDHLHLQVTTKSQRARLTELGLSHTGLETCWQPPGNQR